MPVFKNGRKYYRTNEFCKKTGISKATYFRWVKDGVIAETRVQDKNGWRLFTEKDVKRVREVSQSVQIVPMKKILRLVK